MVNKSINTLQFEKTSAKSLPFDAHLIKAILICLFSIATIILDKNGIFCSITSIILAFWLAFRYRRYPMLFIVFLLFGYCNYSFFIGNFVSPESAFDYSFDKNNELLIISSKVTFLFQSCLFLFLRKKPSKRKPLTVNRSALISTNMENKGNATLALILLALIVGIWFLFYRFSFGSRSNYSPIYEYSVILFIFAFYFSGNTKALRFATLFLALFYVIFDFLGGNRSTGIQIMLVTALSCFYEKLTWKRILLAAFLAMLLINTVALFRSGGSFSLSNISFSGIVSQFIESKFVSDTASWSYYTSNVFLYARLHFTAGQLLVQFVQFIASQFVVGSVGRSVTDIALDYHYHYYGGVLPIYLYYYLGYSGVVLIALLCAKYLNVIIDFNPSKKDWKYIFAIYIISTSFRWYLYSPNQLIRGTILLFVVYWILKRLSKSISRKIA